MKDLRIGLAQVAPRLGDLEANLALHLDTARRGRREGAEVVVFPELSLTGYLLRDQVADVALGLEDRRFRRLEKASRDVDLVVGFVEEAPGHRYYNASAYLSAGRLLHVHRKIHLPTYGMFDEGRDFAPGDRLRAFDAPFGPAGMLICEDAWHPATSWLLAQEGAEVLLVLSSGPTRGARPRRAVTSVSVWQDLLRITAQFLTSYVVYVNRVGYEDGLNFGGGSAVFDPFGREAGSLPSLEAGLAVVELHSEVLRRARTAYPLLRDENVELVRRELDRVLRKRHDLPVEQDGESPAALRPTQAPPPVPLRRRRSR